MLAELKEEELVGVVVDDTEVPVGVEVVALVVEVPLDGSDTTARLPIEPAAEPILLIA